MPRDAKVHELEEVASLQLQGEWRGEAINHIFDKKFSVEHLKKKEKEKRRSFQLSTYTPVDLHCTKPRPTLVVAAVLHDGQSCACSPALHIAGKHVARQA